jgi:hypothetical protein
MSVSDRAGPSEPRESRSSILAGLRRGVIDDDLASPVTRIAATEPNDKNSLGRCRPRLIKTGLTKCSLFYRFLLSIFNRTAGELAFFNEIAKGGALVVAGDAVHRFHFLERLNDLLWVFHVGFFVEEIC